MPLVNYEDSDDEDNSINEDENTKSSGEVKNETKDEHNDSILDTKIDSHVQSLSSTKTLLNPSLNEITVSKEKNSKTVKISVPSLKKFKEEMIDDEEVDYKSKKFKGSSCGTALTALLPKPKHQLIASQALIPQSVKRHKPNLPAPKHLNANIELSSSFSKSEIDKSENNDYFSFESKYDNNVDTPESIINELPKPLPTSSSTSSSSKLAQFYETESKSNVNIASDSGREIDTDLNNVTYKKFIASKFGEESSDDINIIDVDVSKHLSQSNDWLKTISEEKEETYKGVMPTSTARRKHQITFLAFQAKQREVELKNQWAVNRQTKSQMRSKYGF